MNNSNAVNNSKTNDIQSFDTLDQVRSYIDVIDNELVGLLNKRMNVATQYSKVKQSSTSTAHNNKNFDRPLSISNISHGISSSTSDESDIESRERLLYNRIMEKNREYRSDVNRHHILSDVCCDAVWREIISSSISLQRRTVVAIAGQSGSFAHEAAYRKWQQTVDYVCIYDHMLSASSTGDDINTYTAISSVWSAVETGRAQYGIVPFYHAHTGNADPECMEMLGSTENHLDITGELYYNEHYYVLAAMNNKQIKRVYISPTCISTCISYIKREYPAADIIVEHNTRHAAADTIANPSYALVSTALAAELYHLNILSEIPIERRKARTTNMTPPKSPQSISTSTRQESYQQYSTFEGCITPPSDSCRYLIIAQRSNGPTGNDKTFLMFAVKNGEGALHDAITAFKSSNVSLTRIESRASRDRVKIWDYAFFAELEGHMNDPNVTISLQQLKSHANFVRVLGSCPSAYKNQETPAINIRKLHMPQQ